MMKRLWLMILQIQALLPTILLAAALLHPVRAFGVDHLHTLPSSSKSTVPTPLRLSSGSSDLLGSKKGKLLVLGGTGFLGQAICKRAALEGYSVTSISRRGRPPREEGDPSSVSPNISYLTGDCREQSTITNILQQGGYTGIIHCVGLLFDDASGLGRWNRFASGSGSLPDGGSTYDTVTRMTAFNAIDAAIEYTKEAGVSQPLPFCFTSAAEAGWPDVTGGKFVENRLTPDFMKRYLAAKRAVEEKLMATDPGLVRPIILRPSLIYSMDRPASFPAVSAFFVGAKIGLPFVDPPVSVQSLSSAIIRSIGRPDVQGVLRQKEITTMAK